jgi:NADP-dependent 3-hydroxy acid dehydrogenase YdfG
VAVAARSLGELALLKQTVETAGGCCSVFRADFNRQGAGRQLADEVLAQCGRVDILVNNAGRAHWSHVEKVTPAQWDEMFNVNLRSLFFLTQALIPQMAANGGGHIVNISSVYAKRGVAGFSGYCATKWGLDGLSASLAAELKEKNIRVTVIHPGIVATNFRDHMTERLAMLPPFDDAKMIQPDDIARAVLFAINQPATSFVSGIDIDSWLM